MLIDGRGGVVAGRARGGPRRGSPRRRFSGVAIHAIDVGGAPRFVVAPGPGGGAWRADRRVAASAAFCAGAVADARPPCRSAAALIAVDDAGRTSSRRPPQRVVTLAPSLTELVFAAGAGASLVGTSALSDFPGRRARSPAIGDAGRLDVERVMTMKPDLVLVWQRGDTSRELEQLEAAGIRLFQLEPRRLDDVARAIERLGQLLGTRADAARRAPTCAPRSRPARRHAGAAPVRVFYQVWRGR